MLNAFLPKIINKALNKSVDNKIKIKDLKPNPLGNNEYYFYPKNDEPSSKLRETQYDHLFKLLAESKSTFKNADQAIDRLANSDNIEDFISNDSVNGCSEEDQ